jgi:hypothetical protein
MIEKISTKSLFKICKDNNLTQDDVTYKEFFTIALEFNREMSKAILDGYEFKTLVVTLKIIKRRSKIKQINWKASYERKEELISQGIIPYNKFTAPNGEFWFIYYTDGVRYKWEWKRGPNIKKWFSFIPCIANKRLLGQTVNIKKEEKTENYHVSAPKNYIKPTCSFQDFQNLQTT